MPVRTLEVRRRWRVLRWWHLTTLRNVMPRVNMKPATTIKQDRMLERSVEAKSRWEVVKLDDCGAVEVEPFVGNAVLLN